MKAYNKKHAKMKTEAIFDIIEMLNNYDGYYCDLHNEVFNTDYYIIGTHQAKKALKEYDVFDAIETVQEYEKFNFGEIYTDILNPEKLVNMLYYIIGYEVIDEMCNISEFNDNWDSYADEETNTAIIKKMKVMYNL